MDVADLPPPGTDFYLRRPLWRPSADEIMPPVLHGTPYPQDLEREVDYVLARWRELLVYDPPSGLLLRRFIVENQAAEHADAASRQNPVATSRSGRTTVVTVDRHKVQAARVVWLLHYGKWPKGRLARRDGDHCNDRIENLVDMGDVEGPRARGRPRTRPLGVARWRDRWQAYGYAPDGARVALGLFDTAEAAAEARRAYDAGERVNVEPKRSRRVGVTRRGDRWLSWGRDSSDLLAVCQTYAEAVARREAWERGADLV